MKTETTSGGMGKLVLRLILSILLVFSLLGTVGCAVGISVLHSPSQLIAQMHKQNAGQKVYDSLQTRFTTDYNTTAVPANVYMDAISVDWLEQCMEQKLTALYGADSDLLDFSALESSITDYFEKKTTTSRTIPITRSCRKPLTTGKRSFLMPQTCCGRTRSRRLAICPSWKSCGR